MPHYKGMDKGGNNRYMKMAGMKGGKVMKNHGNTQSINTDSQKFDMGRVNYSGMEYKGYDNKAFEYKY